MRKEVVGIVLIILFVAVFAGLEYSLDNEMFFPKIKYSAREGTVLESSSNAEYIVQLREQSVIEKKVSLEKSREINVESKLVQQRNTIEAEQNSFRTKLSRFSEKGKTVGAVKNVLNAIFIKDVTKAELNYLKNQPEVLRIVPNYPLEFNLNESVPLINADDVWQMQDNFGRNLTGEGITIGIIDTGVDYTHPDLGNCTTEEFLAGDCEKVVGGWDFGDDDPDPMAGGEHGTHVASIAAGKGDWDGNGLVEENEGFNGVAPGAKIYALKVSVSSRHTFTDTILRAVDWSVDPNQDGGFSDHLDIISMSAGMPCVYFGGYSGICGPNDILSNAFDNSVQVGVVAVTSAGNSGESAMTIGSPMSKEIIVVGNSDKNDFLAQSSSKGPIFGESFGIVKPDVTAHGVMICAAVPYSDDFNLCREGEYEYKSGTSMSTPHVSGLVALIKQAHPGWSPREIQHSLREGAIEHTVYISPNREGYGRIDALNSVFSEKPPISIVETGGIIVGQEEIIGTAMADSFDHYELYVSKGFFRSAIDLDLITESELSGFLQGETWKGSLEKALEMDDIYLDTFEFSEESNFSEFVPLINEWYLISISTNQKEDETIHLFDSISYENDLYYLKLIGYDIDGMSSEDMSMILVQNSNCGNGIIEFGEECDGIYFNGETCESLGHAGGILNCSAGCQLDVSECSQFVCNYGGSYNLDGTCSLEIMHNFLGSGSIRKTTNDVDDWDSVHDAGQGDAQNIFEVGVMRDQTLEIIKASRLFLSFDTSQLIDEMTISSTELVVFPISIESDDDDGNHYISAVESTQQSPLFLSGEDFNQCGTVDNPVLLSENLYLSEMALGEESKIVLNDEGLNFLNREGFTTFGVREGHDISDEVIDLDKTNTLWVDDMNDYNPAFLRVNYNALFECASVSFGIVSWWPGEGNAEDVVDENDGELKGGVGFAEGRAEQAFSFNSYDDYVEIPDADNLDVTSVTIEAWIKSNNFTGEGTVVLKDYSYGMFIDDYPEEDLFCYFETSAGLLEVAGSGEILLNLEAWNHVACTYDELTGEGNLYINGEIAGLSSIGQINVPILVDDEPLFIGGTPSPSTLYFDGLIDEVSLYNSVLSQNEIQRIYEASSAGKCQSSTCEPQYQCRSDGCGQDPVPEGDAWCEQEYGLEYQCCVRTSPLTCSELGGECMLPEDCDVILASGDECADEGYPRYYCCEEDKGRILREVPQREPVPERGGGGFIEKEKMALSPEGEGFWDWLKKFFE